MLNSYHPLINLLDTQLRRTAWNLYEHTRKYLQKYNHEYYYTKSSLQTLNSQRVSQAHSMPISQCAAYKHIRESYGIRYADFTIFNKSWRWLTHDTLGKEGKLVIHCGDSQSFKNSNYPSFDFHQTYCQPIRSVFLFFFFSILVPCLSYNRRRMISTFFRSHG